MSQWKRVTEAERLVAGAWYRVYLTEARGGYEGLLKRQYPAAAGGWVIVIGHSAGFERFIHQSDVASIEQLQDAAVAEKPNP